MSKDDTRDRTRHRDRVCLSFGQWWSSVGVSFKGQRHALAPPGALWDTLRGNARERWGRMREGGVTTCRIRRICTNTSEENKRLAPDSKTTFQTLPEDKDKEFFNPDSSEDVYLDLWSLLLSTPYRSSATMSSWVERFPYLGHRPGHHQRHGWHQMLIHNCCLHRWLP